ncbi:MAG: hypothetical protein ACFB2Z_11055 [Maricaulaceae bacterium]
MSTKAQKDPSRVRNLTVGDETAKFVSHVGGADVFVTDDGLFIAVRPSNQEVLREYLTAMSAVMAELQPNQRHGLLVWRGEDTHFAPEAITYLFKEIHKRFFGLAILAPSSAAHTAASFEAKLFRRTPFSTFRDPELALDWLRDLRKAHP